MKTEFLGAAYALRSLPLSAQTAINIFAELNESGSGEIGAFYGTPGIVTRALLPGGQGRVLKTSGNGSVLYAVSGANVYAINAAWRSTLIGTLSSKSGPISAASNDTQTVLCHASGWDVIENGQLTHVDDGPPNAIITYIDGYGVFTEGVGGQFGITAIQDFTSISALDIATAEALPDNLSAVFSSQREVWMGGPESMEIWADTGAQDFPFERIPGGVLTTGIAAPRSFAYGDGSVFWVSVDRAGSLAIARSVGYQVEFISTHAIEHAMNEYPTVQDARAYCYEQEGHTFYVVDFPSAESGRGITWAYDCATKLWHRRAWRNFNGQLHMHRGADHAFYNEYHLVIDRDDGTLYSLELDATNDAGARIYRERSFILAPPQEMRRLRCDELELIEEAGVGQELDLNPVTWLELSWDGGVSFGNSRYQGAGTIGSRYHRARWRRNGTGRRPVAKLATTRNAKVAWLGVRVTGELLDQ